MQRDKIPVEEMDKKVEHDLTPRQRILALASTGPSNPTWERIGNGAVPTGGNSSVDDFHVDQPVNGWWVGRGSH